MIDIIIPCYNSHEYLDKALQSIMLQNIKDKFNVLLVDDGSKESYDSFVDFYSKYFKIKLYKLKKNVGPGVSRDKAIAKTKSKYFIFLDSDDCFYSYDSAEKLFNKIEEGYDLVNSGEFDQKRNRYDTLNGNVHGKIYRRKFIEDNNLHFNETRFDEDNYFNNLVKLSGAKEAVLKDCTYFYSYNKKSITNVCSYRLSNMDTYLSNMMAIIKKIKKIDYDYEKIATFIVEKCFYLREINKKIKVKDKKDYYNLIRQYDERLIDIVQYNCKTVDNVLIYKYLKYVDDLLNDKE